MRKVVCIVLIFFCITSAYAKKYKYKKIKHPYFSRVDSKIYHFGFKLGFNVLDFDVFNSDYNNSDSYRAEQISFKTGLTLAVISEWNISDHFSLRFSPGFTFGKRVLTYVNVDDGFLNKARLETFYVDFPLLLKYKSIRIHNFRPYIITGFNVKYDLVPHSELDLLKTEFIKIDRSDYAFEIGAGIDFYMRYFKLSTELKISIGLKDILINLVDEKHPDYAPYTQAIGAMNSKVITLSLNFE